MSDSLLTVSPSVQARPQLQNTPPGYLERAGRGLSYLILGGGITTLGAAVYLVVVAYMRAPFWDMWTALDFYFHRSGSLLWWLWMQHNEHRILLPKLLLLIDYHAFRLRGIFLVAMNLAVQFILVVVLLWALRSWAGLRGSAWRTAAGMAALCAFNTCQWDNFISGFQLAFTLVGLMTVIAVVLLLSSKHNSGDHSLREWRQACFAVLAGMAATYSAANGILVWPILIVVAILQRSRKAVVALLLLGAAIAASSYLFHYVPLPYHASPLTSIRHPYEILVYAAKYVGSPWDWDHPAWGLMFGAVGISVASSIAVATALRSERKPIFLLCVSMVLFVLGSAVITSLGRLNFGTDQAFSSRYETVALLLWLALGLLLLLAVRRSAAGLVILQVILLFIMFLAAPRLRYPLRAGINRALSVNTASLALIARVHDQAELKMLFPDPELPWADAPYLKQGGLSLFASPLASHLGKPLRTLYSLRTQDCWGAVEHVTRIPSGGAEGLRVIGWGWDPFRRESVKQIIFVAHGNIVGYAEPGYVRWDVRKLMAARNAEYAGWTGYVEPLAENSPISVYAAINRSGAHVCRVDYLRQSLLSTSRPIEFSADRELK